MLSACARQTECVFKVLENWLNYITTCCAVPHADTSLGPQHLLPLSTHEPPWAHGWGREAVIVKSVSLGQMAIFSFKHLWI